MRILRSMPKRTDKVFRMKALFFILAISLLGASAAQAGEPDACVSVKNAEARMNGYRAKVTENENKLNGLPATASDTEKKSLQAVIDDYKRKAKSEEEFIIRRTPVCQEARDKLVDSQEKCEEKGRKGKVVVNGVEKPMFEWDASKNDCVQNFKNGDKALADNECNQAEVFAGGTLKGQNCKAATATVKEAQDRNKAITDTTVSLGTAYAQVNAMTASGKQDDAQKRQAQVLQGLAISKLISGGSALTGAAQMKSAATGAEQANQAMSGAYKNLNAACDAQSARFNGDRQACFFSLAPQFQVPTTKAEYASFDRLTGGATQSADAARAANAAATTSGISGLADTLVGFQALQMANQAKKAGNNMASLPPPKVIGIAPFAGASQAPSLGGFGTGTKPTDHGNPANDGTVLGNVGNGNIRGGMKAGKSFGGSPFVSAKSSVSAGGSGGTKGSAGGSTGASKNGGKSRTLGNTGVGEYNLGGGGGANYKGGKDESNPGSNAFADALAKLFPQDETGKPIVGMRDPASLDPDAVTGEEIDESGVSAGELSIFEQINAKYRALSGAGTI